MKNLFKIFLLFCIITYSVNAKEQYFKENIQKHLETLFTKNIKYEKNNKSRRYIPFRDTIKFYYEFTSSIQNQEEKIRILQEVAEKFERIINLKIELKQGKPDITLSEENGKLKTTYNSEESLYEEHIYFGFLNRKELFSKLKNGFWYKKFFIGQSSNMYQKYISYMKRERGTSIEIRSTKYITFKDVEGEIEQEGKINKKIPTKFQIDFVKLKHFHLIELNKYRDTYFKEFITKELYYSLLSLRGRWNISQFIKPSIFNDKNDDFLKEEISQFDLIVLDEFYNNKELKKFMFYKTQVIPILTKSIYKKIQITNNIHCKATATKNRIFLSF